MEIIYQIFIVLLLFLTLPLQLLIGFAIVVSSGLPILYRQKRVGKDGRLFTLFKFRTMVAGASRRQGQLKTLNEADGPVFKIRDDPRFTKVGRFLSHTGLDELPQLFNVMRGDMALIGPRPLPTYEAKKLKVWQQKRHLIKPGIISPWILDGYHSQSFDDWMRSDLAYVQEKSLKSDLILFWRTIVFMIRLLGHELGLA